MPEVSEHFHHHCESVWSWAFLVPHADTASLARDRGDLSQDSLSAQQKAAAKSNEDLSSTHFLHTTQGLLNAWVIRRYGRIDERSTESHLVHSVFTLVQRAQHGVGPVVFPRIRYVCSECVYVCTFVYSDRATCLFLRAERALLRAPNERLVVVVIVVFFGHAEGMGRNGEKQRRR